MLVSTIDSKRTTSAVQRTPVEVWQMILLPLVESPLFPRSGDNVVDGKAIFSICCHSGWIYDKMEALRLHLRLVCQTWNAILDLKDAGHHLASYDHGYIYRKYRWDEDNRKIRRIESIRPCANCMTEPEGYSQAIGIPGDDTTKLVSLLLFPSWEADADYQLEFITGVLDNAPQLRALEISEHEISRDDFTHIINHHALARITHLSVGLLEADSQALGAASFPAVQFLRLEVVNRDPQDHVPNWHFPSITSFYLHRDESLKKGGDLFEGLDQFIALHGEKLTSMLIDYTSMGRRDDSKPYHDDKKFWEWFPNLQLFGPAMGALGSLSRPPPQIKLTSLAIRGLHIWNSSRTTYPLDVHIDELLQTCKNLGIKKLVMTNSWETPPYNDTTEHSSWSKRLFEETAANGIQIFDSDGFPATHPMAVRFIEGLRKDALRE
ncbi:hypothetical protein M408DRAFT_305897 [Serendipita vermifera MAFF 305830]|uniref:Uncharacterized protein n=1 Tax=Serendipita vermifera MAFF 305830 TaxID=933852 RepID=A0A0C3ALK9_SERVB|nr:hypothetical protein M408DRAFT_305897 [Serendipita vermifera MAFF 305830]